MNRLFYLSLLLFLLWSCENNTQEQTISNATPTVANSAAKETKAIDPSLLPFQEESVWTPHNRRMTLGEEIYLDAAPNDGLLWNTKETFTNGTIEFDVKGSDARGRSFVGFAFHIQDKDNFDAVYFRPFNFGDSQKGGNALQYIAAPEYGWQKLREEHPGVYENAVSPVPEKADWFHAKIVVNHPKVEVFVNDAETPSLVVDQLSTYKKGGYGFWVGNNSNGSFKNLKITTN